MPCADVVREGRMVLHHDHRLLRERGVGEALLEELRVVLREQPRRSRDRLMTGHVHRHEAEVSVIDDLAHLRGARPRVRLERPFHRRLPSLGIRVRVVIPRHERHALGRDLGFAERLRELLELVRRADLGEVTGDDEVLRAAALRGIERARELARAPPCIEAPAEAKEADAQAVARPSPARTRRQHVNVRQMRDANRRMTHDYLRSLSECIGERGRRARRSCSIFTRHLEGARSSR